MRATDAATAGGPDQTSDLGLLIDAAHEAAEIARGFVGRDLGVTYKQGDKSPVTLADFAVDKALRARLSAARPAYGWLSEETPDDPARLAPDRVFIVDPIDGTRAFIDGAPGWAHALAVADRGQVIASVVYLPMMDKLYAASLGHGARLNGAPLRASAAHDPDAGTVLATRPSLEARHWPGGAPKAERSYRPSLSYRQCLVAEGRFDGMFTFRPTWEWDIAPGHLVLTEAGARITDQRGAALRFNAAHPQAAGLVAAGPALHAALLDRLAR